MVRRAVKRSLRAASCWSLLVVKGGTGFRRFSLRVTEATRKSPAGLQLRQDPVCLPLRADRGLLALYPLELRRNSGGTPSVRASRAVMDQYSAGTKARTSRSRSTTRRRATDWTRPAEMPRRTFSQSRG